MSQYLTFYTRIGDRFIPLASYSRSTVIYQAFNTVAEAPYEKIKAISKDTIINIRNGFTNNLLTIENCINQLLAKKREIATFNNSVEDKLKAIHECDSEIDNWKDDYDDQCSYMGACNFLISMIEEIEYKEPEDNLDDVDAKHYIYCGIEPPVNITLNDIEE